MGVAVGVVGTVAVGAVIVGATFLGVPAALTTIALAAGAIVGGFATANEVRSAINGGNWAQLAFTGGNIVGAIGSGYIIGDAVAVSIDPNASLGWSASRDVNFRYRPSKGSLLDWLKTGPDGGAASGSVTAAGGGGSSLASLLGCQ